MKPPLYVRPLTTAERAKTERLKGEIATLEMHLATPTPAFAAELAAWERAQSQAIAWTTLDPLDYSSAGGATLTKLPDGSLLAGGKAPETVGGVR